MWAVVEDQQVDANGAMDIHVIPQIGPEHELTACCWCNPERDHDLPRIVVHNVVH
jgi:hypothetical protein